MAKTSPTQRTLAHCRKAQWTAQVVEKWNPHARIRQDLFGCIDIVVLHGGILGIQACAGSSHSARTKKALAEPRLKTWVLSGGMFEVWSWAKRGPRGKAKRWTLRRTSVELDLARTGLVTVELPDPLLPLVD